MRRTVSAMLVSFLVIAALYLLATAAVADCAADPDALTPREMIDAETTGEPAFPSLALAVVVSHRDLGGRPNGGPTIARVEVVEHPVGFVGRMAGIHFWKIPPRMGVSPSFELKVDGRYALVVRRLDDGTYRFDGPCRRVPAAQPRAVPRPRTVRPHPLTRYGAATFATEPDAIMIAAPRVAITP